MLRRLPQLKVLTLVCYLHPKLPALLLILQQAQSVPIDYLFFSMDRDTLGAN